MLKVLSLLIGAGTGALLMYLFDPKTGDQRRSQIRDKAVGISNDAKDAFNKTATDLGNRAQGVMHNAKSLMAVQTSPEQNNLTETLS
jgi:gas vesicle protein